MKTILSRPELQERIVAMGREISRDYIGTELVAVGALKGAFVFMADLIREIGVPLQCEFLRVSSYKNDRSTGDVRIDLDLTQSVDGKNVLLIEDIVDTGRTLRFLLEHLKSKKPASVKVCSLLYKEIDPGVRPLIDYLGFTVPNDYVVGYGMDSMGLYRSLPDIRVLSDK